ncbi:MAG: hypothetical protein LUC98_00980 [Lachnospiraceae bacterium]|nr:hypothetical protein [Lachnospiraceae bacterium]
MENKTDPTGRKMVRPGIGTIVVIVLAVCVAAGGGAYFGLRHAGEKGAASEASANVSVGADSDSASVGTSGTDEAEADGERAALPAQYLLTAKRFYSVNSADSIDDTSYTYSYDENGYLVMSTSLQARENAHTRYTEYSYDSSGNLLSEYSYYTAGNVTSQTDYSYDSQGNMLSEISSNLDGIDEINEWTYDEDGNLRTEKNVNYKSDGTVTETAHTYSYDDEGFCLTDYYERDGSLVWVEQYSYDDYGNVITIDYYSDWSDTEPDSTGTYSYVYDENGTILSQTYHDGFGTDLSHSLITEYSYDSAGNVVSKTDKYLDGTLSKQYTYEYDENGNLIFQGEYPASSSNYLEIEYTYEYWEP